MQALTRKTDANDLAAEIDVGPDPVGVLVAGLERHPLACLFRQRALDQAQVAILGFKPGQLDGGISDLQGMFASERGLVVEARPGREFHPDLGREHDEGRQVFGRTFLQGAQEIKACGQDGKHGEEKEGSEYHQDRAAKEAVE